MGSLFLALSPFLRHPLDSKKLFEQFRVASRRIGFFKFFRVVSQKNWILLEGGVAVNH